MQSIYSIAIVIYIQFWRKWVTKYLNLSLIMLVYWHKSKYMCSTHCTSSNIKSIVDSFIHKLFSHKDNFTLSTSRIITSSISFNKVQYHFNGVDNCTNRWISTRFLMNVIHVACGRMRLPRVLSIVIFIWGIGAMTIPIFKNL